MGVIGSIIGQNSGFQVFIQSDNDPGYYADAAARDVYFGANPLELARLDADQFLIIRLADDGTGSVAYQQRAGSNWVDVTSLVQGETGPGGATGNSYFFSSIAARDTFFGTSPNEGLLEANLPIVVNIGNNTASIFEWSGITDPESYDNTKWILSSLEVSSGTLFLGVSGASISSGAELLNFTEAGGDTAYLIGVAYDDTGSTQPNYWKLPAISQIILADVDVDTLSDPQILSLTNTSDVYVKEYTLTPATSGVMRVQTWLGTDETGPGLVDTYITVDPGDIGNPKVFQAPNNTMVLTGQDTYTKFSGIQLKGGLQTTGPFTGQTVPSTALGAWLAERVDLVTQFEDEINLKAPDGTTPAIINFLDSSDTLKGILEYDPNTDVLKLDAPDTDTLSITDGVVIEHASDTVLSIHSDTATDNTEFHLKTSPAAFSGKAFSIYRTGDTSGTTLDSLVGNLRLETSGISGENIEIESFSGIVDVNNFQFDHSTSFTLNAANPSSTISQFFKNSVGTTKGSLSYNSSTDIFKLDSTNGVYITDTVIADGDTLSLVAPSAVLGFDLVFKNFAGATKASFGENQTTGVYRIEATAGDFEIASNVSDLDIRSAGTTYLDSVEFREYISSVFGGFGTLQNYLKYSQEFDNPVWLLSGTNPPTVSANDAMAPNGTMTADTVTYPGPGSGLVRQSSLGLSDSTTYTVSFWLRHVSGGAFLSLDIHDGGGVGVTATSEWKRYNLNVTSGTSGSWLDISTFGLTVIEFWGWQISDGTTTLPYSKTTNFALSTAIEGLSVGESIRTDKFEVVNESSVSVVRNRVNTNGAHYVVTDETGSAVIAIEGTANITDILLDGATSTRINSSSPSFKITNSYSNGNTEFETDGSGKVTINGENILTNLDNLNVGTGVLEGGDISINVDTTKIDVTAGSCIIADYTDPENPVITPLSWTAQLLSPALTGSWNKWLAVKESVTPGVAEFVFDPEFTQSEKRTHAIIGRVWGSGLNDIILGKGQYTTPGFGQAKIGEDLSFVIGSFNKNGNIYSANGANLLLNKTSGKSYRFGAGWGSDPTSPNVHIDAAQTAISAYYYHLQGSTTSDIQTDIEPDYYDLAGSKTAVPSGKYTLQRLYYYPVSQVCAVTYGQEIYDSMAQAIGAAGEDDVTIQEDLIDGSILRGWLAVKEGSTSLNDPSEALFKKAESLNEPSAIGTTGTTPIIKSYGVSDPGAIDVSYLAGFYDAPSTSTTLTIGGTVTQTYGTILSGEAAHFFIVASGAGGTDLVLTVSGISISDAGVRNDSDSEVLVADTDAATTDQYFETDKKWLGQPVATLTGASGSFTFNYGLVKYEDFDNRAFTFVSFDILFTAAANAANQDIEVLHHKSTGHTYAASGFVPGSDSLISMADDYGVNTYLFSGKPFPYKRTGLSFPIDGGDSEGVIVKMTQTTNNPYSYGTAHIGVLI